MFRLNKVTDTAHSRLTRRNPPVFRRSSPRVPVPKYGSVRPVTRMPKRTHTWGNYPLPLAWTCVCVSPFYNPTRVITPKLKGGLPGPKQHSRKLDQTRGVMIIEHNAVWLVPGEVQVCGTGRAAGRPRFHPHFPGKKTPGGAGTHRDTHRTRRRTRAHGSHRRTFHNHPNSPTHSHTQPALFRYWGNFRSRKGNFRYMIHNESVVIHDI